MHSASNLSESVTFCIRDPHNKAALKHRTRKYHLPLFDAESGCRQHGLLNRFPFLVKFDVLGSLHHDQCMPVRQTETVHCPRQFETAQLLAVHVELDDVAIARRQHQQMTVVQNLIATGPAAVGHYLSLLDLSSGLVELDETLTIEGDDPPVGQSAGRDDLAHGHPQNVLARAVHLDELIAAGDEGVTIGQALDGEGLNSLQFPQHVAAEVAFGDAALLRDEDVVIGQHLGIGGALKPGQSPARLAVGAQLGDGIALRLDQQRVAAQAPARGGHEGVGHDHLAAFALPPLPPGAGHFFPVDRVSCHFRGGFAAREPLQLLLDLPGTFLGQVFQQAAQGYGALLVPGLRQSQGHAPANLDVLV